MDVEVDYRRIGRHFRAARQQLPFEAKGRGRADWGLDQDL